MPSCFTEKGIKVIVKAVSPLVAVLAMDALKNGAVKDGDTVRLHFTIEMAMKEGRLVCARDLRHEAEIWMLEQRLKKHQNPGFWSRLFGRTTGS